MKIANESYNIFRTAANPRMAEQDFLECAILDCVFQDPFIGDNFVFAGGGSITKAYSIGNRIGQDLDLACLNFDDIPDIHSKKQLSKFKKNFKTYVFETLRPRLHQLINRDQQFMIVTDREWASLENKEQFLSSPTLHLLYQSKFGPEFGHIRIEVIPRHYADTAISFRKVVPYSIPHPIGDIPTVAYQQTFWDKVHALHSTAKNSSPNISEYFARHYYDVAHISAHVNLAETYHMLGNIERHQQKYTTRDVPTVASSAEIQLIPDSKALAALGADYQQMSGAFISTPETWDTIVQQLHRLNMQMKTL